MTTLTKRATIYLEPQLHKALRVKAEKASRSFSELLNDLIRRELAEDSEDLDAFQSRVHEPTVGYEDFVKRLREHGKV
jgi:hypothetical protein